MKLISILVAAVIVITLIVLTNTPTTLDEQIKNNEAAMVEWIRNAKRPITVEKVETSFNAYVLTDANGEVYETGMVSVTLTQDMR